MREEPSPFSSYAPPYPMQGEARIESLDVQLAKVGRLEPQILH